MSQTDAPFEIPAAGTFPASYLAEVVAVKDPDNLSRVQVRLLGYDGVQGQDAPLWARVATPFAGRNRGAFMLPDVGDEVLVSFVNGDPRLPVVVGSLWNGKAKAPERLGGGGTRVDRWTIVGKAGTRIAITEQGSGNATIKLTTPGNVSGELTQTGGGKIEFKAAGTTITVDNKGVFVQTQADVAVQAAGRVEVKAGEVNVNTAVATFTGVVKCEVLKTTSVVSEMYTPGAGNVW